MQYIVTESELALLATRQANESKRKYWEEEGTLLGSQLTKKMAS